jgi:hypothetical protein
VVGGNHRREVFVERNAKWVVITVLNVYLLVDTRVFRCSSMIPIDYHACEKHAEYRRLIQELREQSKERIGCLPNGGLFGRGLPWWESRKILLYIDCDEPSQPCFLELGHARVDPLYRV